MLNKKHVLESIQESFDVVDRLVLQHLYAAFHLEEISPSQITWNQKATSSLQNRSTTNVFYIYLGGLGEGAVWMDVVVKDDHSHHHPHAKQECILAAEATRIFPKKKKKKNSKGLFKINFLRKLRSKTPNYALTDVQKTLN